MKINFSAAILDLDGNQLKDGNFGATLGKIACTALLAMFEDERNLPGEEKIRRFRIAELAAKGGEQDLKVEEVALLKKLVAKGFGPLIVGRVFDLIEPPD